MIFCKILISFGSFYDTQYFTERGKWFSMKNIDYEYIAENISNIARIPVRVYHNKKLKVLFNTSSFPVDPAVPYLTELLNIQKNISYYITPLYHFYGVIHHQTYTLILGPCYQNQAARTQIRDYMFSLGLKENYIHSFSDLLKSITPMPLELFLHLLCLVNYYVSGEKTDISQLLVYDSSTPDQTPDSSSENFPPVSIDVNNAFDELHNTYHFEKQMLSFVSSGNVSALERLFATTSPGRSGKMAGNYLRQLKNIFISSATLVSRAAIEGGLPQDESFSLSDRYIQHCEKYNDPSQILNLQHHMVLDYASLVRSITNGASVSPLMRSVISYIQEHLTETISTEQLAQFLGLSPNYLSTRFHQESGMTLRNFITQQKINKSKDYLKNTDRSLLEISTFLGFSSQAYFQNVFKKMTGMTPKEYRERR